MDPRLVLTMNLHIEPMKFNNELTSPTNAIRLKPSTISSYDDIDIKKRSLESEVWCATAKIKKSLYPSDLDLSLLEWNFRNYALPDLIRKMYETCHQSFRCGFVAMEIAIFEGGHSSYHRWCTLKCQINGS